MKLKFWEKEIKVNKSLKDFSTEDIENEYLSRFGNVFDYEVTPKDEALLFDSLKTNRDFFEYLKAMQAKDVIRYFNSPDETNRSLVRGAFLRTLYFYKLMRNVKPKEKKKVDTKIGTRYA